MSLTCVNFAAMRRIKLTLLHSISPFSFLILPHFLKQDD